MSESMTAKGLAPIERVLSALSVTHPDDAEELLDAALAEAREEVEAENKTLKACIARHEENERFRGIQDNERASQRRRDGLEVFD